MTWGGLICHKTKQPTNQVLRTLTIKQGQVNLKLNSYARLETINANSISLKQAWHLTVQWYLLPWLPQQKHSELLNCVSHYQNNAKLLTHPGRRKSTYFDLSIFEVIFSHGQCLVSLPVLLSRSVQNNRPHTIIDSYTELRLAYSLRTLYKQKSWCGHFFVLLWLHA